ncbi:MAG: hypothetical protein R2825_06385 [Saprospiraceae bacterium]
MIVAEAAIWENTELVESGLMEKPLYTSGVRAAAVQACRAEEILFFHNKTMSEGLMSE